ncbi:MAG TPA: glucosaminidase domain-containing protein [Gammaproteobacteria bacterium]|nr:glucosaminidase domain-containing protein [Gammaproteobacteria bacterium]
MSSVALTRQRLEWWGIALVLVPLVLAAILSFKLLSPEYQSHPLLFEGQHLQPVNVAHAQVLAALYTGIDYDWPPTDAVPALALQHFPNDMDTLAPKVRKRVFFQALLPIVLAENARIASQRAFIKAQFANGGAGSGVLQRLATHYGISGDLDDPQVQKRLLRRVDVVPAALVLAQAAKESGWGTSRFAREGNNLFGVWTWNADAGIAPRGAPDDANHYVRTFPDIRASVRDYLYNIDVGHAYLKLRKMRAQLRAHGDRPTALQLAEALENYSARGARYVDAVQKLIRRNGLAALGGPRLAPWEVASAESPGLSQN